MKAGFVSLGLIVLLAACGGTVQQSSASLAGEWSLQVEVRDRVTRGQMTLQGAGTSYHGTLTTDQGSSVLPVRWLKLAGASVEMLVDSPQGNVIFRGSLLPGNRVMDGVVTYHNGESFPMTARKQASRLPGVTER